jgi:hypothetical protein
VYKGVVDNYGEMVQEICSGQSFALEIGLLQVCHYIKSLLIVIDLLKSGNFGLWSRRSAIMESPLLWRLVSCREFVIY